MDPRIEELKSLLGASRHRRPKSTYYLFFTWKDCASMLGMGARNFRNIYQHRFPGLPVTRIALERLKEEILVKKERKPPLEKMARAFRYRILLNKTVNTTMKLMGFRCIRRWFRFWKKSLKYYSEIQPLVPGLPPTLEEALEILRVNTLHRRRNGIKKADKARAAMAGRTQMHARSLLS